MSKTKQKIYPRIPEGEAIEEHGMDMTMEELNKQFKKRMKESKRFVNFIVKVLQLQSHSNVLEIGPGPSWISIMLVKMDDTIQLTGLEISEDMIQIAEKNIRAEGFEENITLLLGNAKDMSMFDDNSFDAVISHDSLHHWENPLDIFNEIGRVLKDDGILCVADGRRDIGIGAKIIFNLARLIISKQMSCYWKSSIMASYTPGELIRLLNQTNLKGRFNIKADLFDIIVHNKL